MDKYNFGNKLTEYRIQKGLTQEELGKILGVSNKAVSKWENGSAMPRLDMMVKITSFFGVSIDEFVGNELPATQANESEKEKRLGQFYEIKLKEFSKKHKQTVIIMYVLLAFFVVLQILNIFIGTFDSSLDSLKNESFYVNTALNIFAVFIAFKLKNTFEECNIKAIKQAGLLISLYSMFFTAAAYYYANDFGYTIFIAGIICFAVNTIVLFSAKKDLHYIQVYKNLSLIFCFAPLIMSVTCENLSAMTVALIYSNLFYCLHIILSKKEWLMLVQEEFDYEKTEKKQNINFKLGIAITAVLLVVLLVTYTLLPYAYVKIKANSVPENAKKPAEAFEDYSIVFNGENTKEINLSGVSFRIPSEFERKEDVEGEYVFTCETGDRITVFLTKDHEMHDEEITDEDYDEVSEAYYKNFGLKMTSMYDSYWLMYCYDYSGLKWYERTKTSLLLTHATMKAAAYPSCNWVRHYQGENGKGFVLYESHENIRIYNADLWDKNEEADYSISIQLMDKNQNDGFDYMTLCKIINSVEFSK